MQVETVNSILSYPNTTPPNTQTPLSITTVVAPSINNVKYIRYIRHDFAYVAIAGIEAFGPGSAVNLVSATTAIISPFASPSTLTNPWSNVLDGNNNSFGQINDITATLPFIVEISMNSVCTLAIVNIINRNDGFKGQLRGGYIELLDSSRTLLFSSNRFSDPDGSILFDNTANYVGYLYYTVFLANPTVYGTRSRILAVPSTTNPTNFIANVKYIEIVQNYNVYLRFEELQAFSPGNERTNILTPATATATQTVGTVNPSNPWSNILDGFAGSYGSSLNQTPSTVEITLNTAANIGKISLVNANQYSLVMGIQVLLYDSARTLLYTSDSFTDKFNDVRQEQSFLAYGYYYYNLFPNSSAVVGTATPSYGFYPPPTTILPCFVQYVKYIRVQNNGTIPLNMSYLNAFDTNNVACLLSNSTATVIDVAGGEGSAWSNILLTTFDYSFYGSSAVFSGNCCIEITLNQAQHLSRINIWSNPSTLYSTTGAYVQLLDAARNVLYTSDIFPSRYTYARNTLSNVGGLGSLTSLLSSDGNYIITAFTCSPKIYPYFYFTSNTGVFPYYPTVPTPNFCANSVKYIQIMQNSTNASFLFQFAEIQIYDINGNIIVNNSNATIFSIGGSAALPESNLLDGNISTNYRGQTNYIYCLLEIQCSSPVNIARINFVNLQSSATFRYSLTGTRVRFLDIYRNEIFMSEPFVDQINHQFVNENAQASGWYNYTVYPPNPRVLGTPYKKLSSDTSGKYLSVVRETGYDSKLFVSLNYGKTWFERPILDVYDTCMSADGSVIYVTTSSSSKSIYVSLDRGVTFSKCPVTATTWFSSVVCTDSGTTVYAVDPSGRFFASTNSGTTWTTTVLSTNSLCGIDCSSNGQYIIIGCKNLSMTDNNIIYDVETVSMYTSSNYGATFNQFVLASKFGYTRTLSQVQCSASGAMMTVQILEGYTPSQRYYYTTNLGTTWTQVTLPTNTPVLNVSMTKDASRLILGRLSGGYLVGGNVILQTSTNLGGSWTTQATYISSTSDMAVGISIGSNFTGSELMFFDSEFRIARTPNLIPFDSDTYLYTISIGANTGITRAGADYAHAIAIGTNTGATQQYSGAIAIGYCAGQIGQGTNSISIGAFAGQTYQHERTIILNNQTDTTLQSQAAGSMYIGAIRSVPANTSLETMYYLNANNEIVSQPTSTLLIQSKEVVVYNTVNDPTPCKKQTIQYYGDVVYIKTSDIVASVNTYCQNDQTYFFGPPEQNNTWLASASQTGNTLAYSTDAQNYVSMQSNVFGSLATGAVYNGRMWVAGGSVSSGTNTTAYSFNGYNWFGTGTGSFSSFFHGMAWSPSRMIWVGVGSGTNNVGYSYDGINWIVSNLTFLTNVYHVAWNGDIFVISGYNATDATKYLMWSEDGITWNLPTSAPALTLGNYAIEAQWNGSIWVACLVSSTNSFLSSPDGTTWSLMPSLTGIQKFDTAANGIAWDGKKFVAVGQSSTAGNPIVLISASNGRYWQVADGTSKNLNLPFSNFGSSIYWNGSRFGMGCDGVVNAMAWSQDGICWDGVPPGGIVTRRITFNNQRRHTVIFPKLVSLALGTDTTSGIRWSRNGLTWTSVTNWSGTTAMTTANSAAWDGFRWVAVGNRLAVGSADGKTWNTTSCIFGGGTNVGNAVATDSRTKFVAVGTGTTHTIIWSADGISWQGLGIGIFSAFGTGIAYNGTLWVATGSGTNSIASSPDGINWTGHGRTLALWQCNAVAWNGSMWIVTSNEGALGYSYNGTSWAQITPPSPFSIRANGIAWYNNTWIATGSGTNTIAYSYNGFNWTGVSGFSSIGFGVVWVGTRWIAGGDGTNKLLWSANGQTWSSTGVTASIFTTQTNGVACNYSKPSVNIQHPTLLFGSTASTFANTMAYTMDGISRHRPLGVNIFSTRGNGAFWNGTIWVAVGSGTNTLAWSNDGINWAGLGTGIFSAAGRGVCWNGTVWVAVGEGSSFNMAYSFDGKVWNGIPNTFSTRGNAVCWNGAYFGAVGEGTSSFISFTISSTGVMTTAATIATATWAVGNGIGWARGTWVIVGERTSGGGTETIAYSLSNTGNSFTGIVNSKTLFVAVGRTVAWNGSTWVVGGDKLSSGFTLATSADGISWTSNNFTGFTGACNAVVWNGARFVATGTLTTSGSPVAFSRFGSTWHLCPSTSTIANTLFSAGWGVAANPRVGFPQIDNQLVLDRSGIGMDNQLDIVSDAYYDVGYSTMTMRIRSSQIIRS